MVDTGGGSMEKRQIIKLWQQASRIDASLKVFNRHLPALLRRRLVPEPFSRELLFQRMQEGKPLLATGVICLCARNSVSANGKLCFVHSSKAFPRTSVYACVAGVREWKSEYS
jgi:hypothetical protein